MASEDLTARLGRLLELRSRFWSETAPAELRAALTAACVESGVLPGAAGLFVAQVAAEAEARARRPEPPLPRFPEGNLDEGGSDGEIEDADAPPAHGSSRVPESPLASRYQREVAAVAALAPRLAFRAPARPLPPWIEHLPGTSEEPALRGLLHGGVLRAAGFRLCVRAFRFTELVREPGAHGAYRLTEVVAGACEQLDEGGQRRALWSTAERLQGWYASPRVTLPLAPSVLTSTGRHGFFRPAGSLLGFPVEPQQAALPEPLTYTARVLREGGRSVAVASAFAEAPSPAAALESPLFTAAAPPSSEHGLDTAYLSLFAPGPEPTSVLVALPSVFREAVVVSAPGAGFRTLHFARRASWQVRLFTS